MVDCRGKETATAKNVHIAFENPKADLPDEESKENNSSNEVEVDEDEENKIELDLYYKQRKMFLFQTWEALLTGKPIPNFVPNEAGLVEEVVVATARECRKISQDSSPQELICQEDLSNDNSSQNNLIDEDEEDISTNNESTNEEEESSDNSNDSESDTQSD